MTKSYKKYSTSWLTDVSSIFDLGGTLSRNRLNNIVEEYDSIEIQTEEEALRSDWEAVGSYISSAIKDAKTENVKKR
jgi:hypothetical protein